MTIIRLVFLCFILFGCKHETKEDNPQILKEFNEENTISKEVEIDTIYEMYKKGKVNTYNWDLVFNRADNYRKVSKAYSNKEQIPDDFLDFVKQFTSSPKYQKNHIDFDSLLAVVGGCEEIFILKENNWIFDDYNFIEEIGIDEKNENTFHYSDTIFLLEYKLKEVGTLTILGFEKIHNEWKLTIYFQNDC